MNYIQLNVLPFFIINHVLMLSLNCNVGNFYLMVLKFNRTFSSFHSSQVSLEAQPGVPTKVVFDREFENVELQHLKPIATLGVGGFGRVELVSLIQLKSVLTYLFIVRRWIYCAEIF